MALAANESETKFGNTKAWSVESGLLWEAGKGTPISYRLMPTQVSWRSAPVLAHRFNDGSMIVLRHRFGAVGTWVQEGPESLYLGVHASPSLEWWNPTKTWALYGGAGGGVGRIDSRNVVGGQGQDFTLNWFLRAGIECTLSDRTSLLMGVMLNHWSNGGQTDPNPSVNALGFTFGLSRSY